MTGRPDRSSILAAATLVLVTAAAIAAVLAPSGPHSLAERTDAVAATLRCPTCQGETVEESNTPIARSMRAEVRRQLGAGRSPDAVRAWFRDRYGDQVVVLPGTAGWQQAWWWLPVLALGAGAAVLTVRARRSAARGEGSSLPEGPVTARTVPAARLAVVAVAVVAVAVAVPVAARTTSGSGATPSRASGSASASAAPSSPPGPGDLSARDWSSVARSLEAQGDYAGAVRAYRKALRATPSSATLRTGLAFALVRDERPAEAERVVAGTAHTSGARPLAVLVLGLAQRAQHEPAATPTLRRFLRLAPDHPAAPQVRRLLRSS